MTEQIHDKLRGENWKKKKKKKKKKKTQNKWVFNPEEKPTLKFFLRK